MCIRDRSNIVLPTGLCLFFPVALLWSSVFLSFPCGCGIGTTETVLRIPFVYFVPVACDVGLVVCIALLDSIYSRTSRHNGAFVLHLVFDITENNTDSVYNRRLIFTTTNRFAHNNTVIMGVSISPRYPQSLNWNRIQCLTLHPFTQQPRPQLTETSPCVYNTPIHPSNNLMN